jgi:hypothetical protein
MRRKPRIGELLSEMVHLSEHDVEEILQEQKSCGKRFGEIAMSWGLCEPEHVWRAWCNQTGDRLERVHLDRIGVDAQAVGLLPREQAIAFHAIPIRRYESLIVIALADPAQQERLRATLASLGKQLKFVLADPMEVDWAIGTYYAPSAKSA